MNDKHDRFEDRRAYFRVEDEVNLYYKKIDEKQVNDMSYVSDNVLSSCSLTAAMDIMSQESRLIQRRLERNNPDVADYLKVLEDKIDLIAQAIVMQGADFSEQSSRNVNLSASGLAFDCEEQLRKGDFLEIRMLLASCMAVIVIYCKVVNCRMHDSDNNQYPYIVGVDYLNIKEQDRELLIKHVVKKQMQQIRESKDS